MAPFAPIPNMLQITRCCVAGSSGSGRVCSACVAFFFCVFILLTQTVGMFYTFLKNTCFLPHTHTEIHLSNKHTHKHLEHMLCCIYKKKVVLFYQQRERLNMPNLLLLLLGGSQKALLYLHQCSKCFRSDMYMCVYVCVCARSHVCPTCHPLCVSPSSPVSVFLPLFQRPPEVR